MKKLSLIIIAVCLGLLGPADVFAQRASVGVNAGDLALAGSIGVDAGYAIAQHWTVNGEARFNPWTFGSGKVEYGWTDARDVAGNDESRYAHQTYSLGVRWWPWYVYSGWWAGAKLQFQEYSRGGFRGKIPSEEGDAFGVGLSGGYALMLNANWNLSVGAGVWSGVTNYVAYDCEYCGRKTGSGSKVFFLPNEFVAAFTYIF